MSHCIAHLQHIHCSSIGHDFLQILDCIQAHHGDTQTENLAAAIVDGWWGEGVMCT